MGKGLGLYHDRSVETTAKQAHALRQAIEGALKTNLGRTLENYLKLTQFF